MAFAVGGIGKLVGGVTGGTSIGSLIGGVVGGVGGGASQVDFFLKIEGIPGESQDSKHKGEIDLLSWSFGASQAATVTGGGLGAGTAVASPFHFVAHFSTASPKLFLACLNGEHFKSGVLTCRKAGTTQQEYLQVFFTELMIADYQSIGGAGAVQPTDQVALVFTKIEVGHKAQTSIGNLAAATRMGFDFKMKKPF